ncbi:MAG: Dihydroneopterin aldolase [Bacteroidetes bacterium ADurb.Bin008]|jgi:dihydroneopterin aldolase|nr:MAG: Dihydroneopterin aldolase [Bacteroidetes bacterium ADurb.Bin008]
MGMHYICVEIGHLLTHQSLTPLKSTIELENMKFYAYHGCYREEQTVGNQFTVSVGLETNSCNAVVTDNLKDALNYQQAYEIVKKEMAKPSHLLEHLAGRILDALFREFELLESAWVKVSKMNPPMGGKMDCVSVTLSKNRRDA